MGTGLRPNRMPGEWEKRPLEMTKESPQGPMVTTRPTARDLAPRAESRTGQAPLPTEVVDVIDDAGGYVAQIISGRPGIQAERARPGDAPVINSGFPGPDGIMTTKGGITGKTLGKGSI